jgi:hypothetical protein
MKIELLLVMVKFRLTKKMLLALISGILFLSGCASTPVIPEYDLKPEIKEEIFRIIEGKNAGLTLQYSEIETTEGPEGLEAGKEFFEIVKKELEGRGFNVNESPPRSSSKIDIKMDFIYKKGIPLLTRGYIETRWKVSFRDDPVFEIVNCKTLRDSVIGYGRVFNKKKGEELSKLIVDDFMEELEAIK